MVGGTRDRWNLFLCSFTILFVELVCIRWIPAYIRYLGYFTNFVLLGSFLGIGLGILQARRRLDLHTFFPLALAVLVWVVSTFKLQLTINTSQEVFFQDLAVKVQGTESFFLLPLVFGVVTLLFTLLGQNLGRLLAAVRPPLTAYTLDVAGAGAGSGSDADIAYHNGIRHITAVEIDPTIYDLGRRLHPDHIYQRSGVHVVIGDGRAFLERTQGTYDLIVFALPDSLALTSSFANLRLESYLFTREAFAAARRHLSSNGVLVLYNYYRQRWIVTKIAGMLTDVFGRAPYGRIVVE